MHSSSLSTGTTTTMAPCGCSWLLAMLLCYIFGPTGVVLGVGLHDLVHGWCISPAAPLIDVG